MPTGGAYILSEAHDKLVIICPLCNRRGEYGKASLLARYGDVALPHLLVRIAQDGGCERAKTDIGTEMCQAVYAPESRLAK